MDTPESCELAIQLQKELREEIMECSNAKDVQLASLALQVQGMHGDLSRIDKDIKVLTAAVTDISKALDTIAKNTTAISDVLLIYQNLRGFGSVTKYIAVAVVGVSALAAAVIYLLGLQVHIAVGG